MWNKINASEEFNKEINTTYKILYYFAYFVKIITVFEMLIVLVIFLKFYLLEFDLFVTRFLYFLLAEIALLIKLIVVPAFIKQKAFMLLLNNNIYSELTKKDI
mgnify:FL=1